jgi:hypothetical protein
MSGQTGKRCAKRRFPTLDSAESALLDCRIKASLRGRQNRQESRVYACPRCGGYHLTDWAHRYQPRGKAS